MLQLEIAEKAKELWPKSTAAELSLLTKVFSNVDSSRAMDILEEARIDSQYQSLPLKNINAKARDAKKRKTAGNYIECWAVHKETGKFKTAWVMASDDYGAKVMMAKRLKTVCEVEPTDYIIVVGSNAAFQDCRMKILGFRKDTASSF